MSVRLLITIDKYYYSTLATYSGEGKLAIGSPTEMKYLLLTLIFRVSARKHAS